MTYKAIEKPQLNPLFVGKQFKVIEVTGSISADMPMHYCTSEAVVTIQKGAATLAIDGQQHRLKTGDSFLIPANKHHSLKVEEALKAVIVMAHDGAIEFAK